MYNIIGRLNIVNFRIKLPISIDYHQFHLVSFVAQTFLLDWGGKKWSGQMASSKWVSNFSHHLMPSMYMEISRT